METHPAYDADQLAGDVDPHNCWYPADGHPCAACGEYDPADLTD